VPDASPNQFYVPSSLKPRCWSCQVSLRRNEEIYRSEPLASGHFFCCRGNSRLL